MDLNTVAFLAYTITSRMDLTVFLRTQPLYEDLQKIIESMHGIPDYLDNSKFIDPGKRNLNSFDDPMTEENCQRKTLQIYIHCVFDPKCISSGISLQ